MYIDSHTHLYLHAFHDDREAMVNRAIESGVKRMLLPNIDHDTITPMFNLAEMFPDHCLPMMGLHPTSVKENYAEELQSIESQLDREGIIAIGETGIDLYWDKTFLQQQKEVFEIQIGWARELNLPLVIHARDSFHEIFESLDRTGTRRLRGVFHSFSGSHEVLEKALTYDFMFGINGIVTFKNSGLGNVVEAIPKDRLLLETDAPFLAPVPFRGKRNESSYLLRIAERLAEIYNLTQEEIGEITTQNAMELFQLDSADGHQ